MNSLSGSRLGKWIIGLVATAMLCLTSTASAQIERNPVWAVVEFANLSGQGPAGLGASAAEAVANEFGRAGLFDVLPQETVAREVQTLGLVPPIRHMADLIRLGQNLQAETVVSGEIVRWRVNQIGEGRQADVLLRIEVRDVASGLTVNGAALQASSGVRTGDVSDETLLTEAFAAGASTGVREIMGRTLPEATVLNTLREEALINKGTRSGFMTGQTVIIIRARTQVAQAVVRNVDPDSGFIAVTRQIKGVQPGDKVRVIFAVPDIRDFGRAGEAVVARTRRVGNNAGLASLLLVLGLAAVLFMGGRGGQADLVTNPTARAVTTPGGIPGIEISWTRDSFLRGTQQVFAWQVWRDDVVASPVAVTVGADSRVIDDALGTRFPQAGHPWYDFDNQFGGTMCTITEPPEGDEPELSIGVLPGRPYQYSVQVIYRMSPLDVPGDGGGGGGTGGGGTGGGGTGGGGTGGGGTGGGGTGGGGTGGGGTGGGGGGNDGAGIGRQTDDWCYFASRPVATRGLATALLQPALIGPDDAAVINAPFRFRFQSVRGPVAGVQLEYVIQISPNPQFPRDNRRNVSTRLDLNTAGGITISSDTVDLSLYYPAASVLYWRVGVRNIADVPGPRDGHIWSTTRSLQRQVDPPGPPL